MSALRNYLNKIKPNFQKGGKLHAFESVFDGFESFLYVPNTTAKSGAHIHDAIDSKRIMSFVVIALIPALLFGMYNVGYQNYQAAGTLATASFLEVFGFGFLAVLPKLLVSYIVGLGIEFAWAQWKHEEIQEGYLVSGIIIPLIIPVTTPLWMLALACAFAVIFCKEIFGGTGMNIFNVAVGARMFLFFSYPLAMSGDKVWIAKDSIFGLGNTFGRRISQRLLRSDSWLRTLRLQLISAMPSQVSSLAVSVRHPSSPSPSVPLSFSGLVLHLGRPWALYSQVVS